MPALRTIQAATIVLALGLGSVAALAQDAPADAPKPGSAAEKAAKKLAKYEPTGESRQCLPLIQIDRSDVVDDQNILFHMRGGKTYLNTLPYRCPRLGFEESFSYRTSINQLCNVDIITVFDPTGFHGPSCGLGTFKEMIEKKESAAE